MRTVRLAPLAASAVMLANHPAHADQVMHFEFAHAPAARAVPSLPDATKKSESAPLGIPGFYDPTTRAFKPLVVRLQSAPTVYTGEVVATVNVKAGSATPSEATAYCELHVLFGNVLGTPRQFFEDHHVLAFQSFPLSQKSVVVRAYYTQVPNGTGNAKMRLALTCSVNNDYTYASVFRPAQDLVSGSVPVTFEVRL